MSGEPKFNESDMKKFESEVNKGLPKKQANTGTLGGYTQADCTGGMDKTGKK